MAAAAAAVLSCTSYSSSPTLALLQRPPLPLSRHHLHQHSPLHCRRRCLSSCSSSSSSRPGQVRADLSAAAAAAVVELSSSSIPLPLLLALAPEPSNALSLPTWAIHVSSVVEWVTAMFLVYKYGELPGRQAWKGLTWGMVPLLAGAMCACTWHLFYNSQELEVLVVLQAALTFIGNVTVWIAAFRIYQSDKEQQA